MSVLAGQLLRNSVVKGPVAWALAVALGLLPSIALVSVAQASVLRASAVQATVVKAGAVRDTQYWLADYGIEKAWSITRGAGVRIAFIDTGVDGSHPDLAGAVVAGADFSGLGSIDGQTPVGLVSRHGTMVASLGAGRGHGVDGGVIGSAPEAGIVSVSVSFEGTTVSPDDQIARAVRFAVDKGAGVISLSLTRNTSEWPESWDDAFRYAAEKDVVVIASAGNRGSGTMAVGAPATMPGVLAVGGVTREGVASDAASSQGITIAVMAPSEGLVGAVPGGGYTSWSGTSGATPIVAGIAALVRSAFPSMDANNVINRLVATATPVTDNVPDPLYGFGLVNAYDAVTRSVPLVSANPLGSLEDWIVLHREQRGVPAVFPLGPAQVGTETVEFAPPPMAVEDTKREALPFLMTGAFVLALEAVVAIGALRVFRARQRG
jgi:subtilisin family serine protease